MPAAVRDGEIARRFGQGFNEIFSRAAIIDGEDAPSLQSEATTLLDVASIRQPGQAAIAARAGSLYIVNDDMPFLVDSVSGALHAEDFDIDRIVHPIVNVLRDEVGRIVALGPDAKGAKPESMMVVLFRSAHTDEMLERAAAGLAAVLGDVRHAVGDWTRMLLTLETLQQGVPAMPRSAEAVEVLAFLDWLKTEHFTFLGYRRYDLSRQAKGTPSGTMVSVAGGTGLGVLRDDDVRVFGDLRGFIGDTDTRNFLFIPQRLIVTKTAGLSTVHRRVPMDAVAVKRLDASGQPTELHLFVGLFTTRAYGRPARDIPLLRDKVSAVMRRLDYSAASHNGKLALHVLDTYPRDELFQLTEDELLSATRQLVSLESRPRFGLFLRADQFGQFVSLMVYLPREQYDFALRRRIEAACLEAIPGAGPVLISESSVSAGDQLARLHLVLQADPALLADIDPDQVEQRLEAETIGWGERLTAHLTARFATPESLDSPVGHRYALAFPAAFRERTTPLEAVEDVAAIEALLSRPAGAPVIRLAESVERAPAQNLALLTFYRQAAPIPLSDLLPILERFGLRVLTEEAHEIALPAGPAIALQRLAVAMPQGAAPADHGAALAEAFQAIWLGHAESDGFNRLTILAGLSSRRIVILRAYAKYLRQAQFRFTQEAIELAFITYPRLALQFAELFEIRHNPKSRSTAEAEAKSIEDAIARDLANVANADDDAIFRAYRLLIHSTLRTNYFQFVREERDGEGRERPVLSLKIDSQAIAILLPPPRPLVEIFVYSARVEAVHLRGGRVARGGIRWSDRREDFRTEILGLMKAQMVKNTVIVPVGSKGGFVCKQPPLAGGRAALHEEGIACYRLMMRGMLDITDNLAFDGTVIPPQNVVRHDGDDPYLVVAADKGTATFSDIANAISREYGFWLDDAFASGGSSGYDHKKMAITARGAWESVKRHFRELGKDVQNQALTVAGVGDMSGDVFGNGMLQSKMLKLVAAFDHRHIFLDPTPDPGVSFAERQRLFDLPASSWDDYDKTLLSPGGMIVPRTVKTMEIGPEIRQALDIEAAELSPSELIRAILKAPVDLIFFGGIGTYVKGPQESNGEAGDRANDANRVNGGDMRAKVIGEGANLAMTQKGRIAFAMAGGRLNTDFIDNSAGVDTSDHEVNIKVLLKPVLDSAKLSVAARDTLLETMTDEVASLVLADNYQQTQTLTRMEMQAGQSFDADARFMRALERAAMLDRVVENLPDDEELAARAAGGRGLTRPELAVVLAYGKLTAYEPLLKGDVALPGFDAELSAYFPHALQQGYAPQIKSHALRREIVITRLVNRIVNRAGPTFFHDMETATGAGYGAIAAGFLRAEAAFALPDIWREIEGMDGVVPAREQTRMLAATEALMRRVVPRLLRPGIVSGGDAHTDRLAVTALSDAVITADPEIAREIEVTPPRFRLLTLFSHLVPALDLVPLSTDSRMALGTLAMLYVEITRRFDFGWLARSAAELPYATDWERRAATSLIDEAYDLAQALTRLIAPSGASRGAVDRFVEKHARVAARVQTVLGEAHALAAPNLPLLMLVIAELRRLVQAARE